LAPVLDLLGSIVTASTVWLDGRLELRFEGDVVLEVPPHPRSEAWQVAGSDGLLIVCTPGGGEPALWPGGDDQVSFTVSPRP
jgi:hypothetical protein